MVRIYLNDEAQTIESTQSLHDLLMQNNHVEQHLPWQ